MTNKKVTQRAQLIREVGALQERVAQLEEELRRREKVEEALGEVQKAELRMAQESASLTRIGQVISSTLEIEHVYQQFALEVRALVDFDRMSIDIADQETGTFTCKYLFGQDVPGRYVGAVLPIHDNQIGRVLATGQCLIHEDLSRQLELATDTAFLDAGLRSALWFLSGTRDALSATLACGAREWELIGIGNRSSWNICPT